MAAGRAGEAGAAERGITQAVGGPVGDAGRRVQVEVVEQRAVGGDQGRGAGQVRRGGLGQDVLHHVVVRWCVGEGPQSVRGVAPACERRYFVAVGLM